MSKLFEAIERARREGTYPRDEEMPAPDDQHGRPRHGGPDVGKIERGEETASPDGPDVVESAFDLPEEHMVSLVVPTSFEAEEYRRLRQRVEELHNESGVSAVAVTSAAVGDGKTVTAVNLAGALAQTPENRVLLFEADLRRPSMKEQLGIAGSDGFDGFDVRGLVDAVSRPGLSLEDIVVRRPEFNLNVVLAGRSLATPYEIFRAPRLGELLDEARRLYDYVVVDTPPVLSGPDCRLLEPHVDGFLLVVAAHKTPRKLFEEAMESLAGPKVLGLVFNGDERQFGKYYRYGYARQRRPNWRRHRR